MIGFKKNELKNRQEHSNHLAIEAQSRAFFKNGRFDWTRSKDKIWADLEGSLERRVLVRRSFVPMQVVRYAVAASIVLILGSSFFIRFYSQTVVTSKGQHQSVTLPDGSTAYLNAESELTYHPYWWRFSRILKFEGEGFFEVKEGNNFSVHSNLGSTWVLGTSFNIFSRGDVYEVTCIKGKVKVVSDKKKKVILEPQSKAAINTGGTIRLMQQVDILPVISWIDNLFLFTAKPVKEVFREIERQYGVTIQTDRGGDLSYSGNFSKDQPVEEILDYICLALGFEYIKTSPGSYKIIAGIE